MQPHNENMTSLRALLERLPTEQLDQMLHAELEKEEPEKAAVQLILSVLEQREDALPEEPPTPQEVAAWEQYQRKMEDLVPRAKPKRPFLWNILGTAAVLSIVMLMLFTLLPTETRANLQLQMKAMWGEDTLEIVGPDGPDSEFVEYQFRTDNPGLQQVYDEVVKMGVDLPVVPMWLPEGYELLESKKRNSSKLEGVFSVFSRIEDQIVFSVDAYRGEVSHEYQKNDLEYTPYEYCGITHDIARNNNRWVVVWIRNDNIECSFTIECPEDTLHKIIRSIYVWEDF